MNLPVKAVLLSALIFPGLGQLSVGHKKRGWFIITVTCLFLYLLINEIIQQAVSIVEKMQNEGVVLDLETISRQTSGLVAFSDNSSLNTLLLLLILCWIVSIIDAYFLTGKSDNK